MTRRRRRAVGLSMAALLAGCATAGGEGDEALEDELGAGLGVSQIGNTDPTQIGREVGAPRRLVDGDELEMSAGQLVRAGKQLFDAVWTPQEGGGRPFAKGTGGLLSDLSSPLHFPRNFNRLSAPDSNSCASCHNVPRPGGGGHFTANAFLPMHRFDFLTFDHADTVPGRGAVDERGQFVTTETAGDARATIGMFGSGYIEMLARQMTAALQAQRDALAPGGEVALVTKGVSFGVLRRAADGTWDTTAVEGLPAGAVASVGADSPPSLVINPFHQSGTVTSLRQFTNNAMNHHHGIQTIERFGAGQDHDGDGFTDEMNRAEVTATTVFQATLPVPGRVIPRVDAIEQAVWTGEQAFEAIGCASCHMTSLPLDAGGWVFSEPNPFNPPGNLQVGEAEAVSVNLNSPQLPGPRLKVVGGVVAVPAYTDLKLHDISTGPDDPNAVPIDISAAGGSDEFFAGNTRWLTKKLWGAANEPPYFHHGKFTTLREAIEAHAGEAATQADNFRALDAETQGAVIEFLKSLQVLPPGTNARVVDEYGNPRPWPPASY